MTSYRLIDSPLGAVSAARTQGQLPDGSVYFEGQKYYPAGAVPGVVPESAAPAVRRSRQADRGVLLTDRQKPSRCRCASSGRPASRRVCGRRCAPSRSARRSSYGDLAGQLGLPHGHARAVGGAVGRNLLSVVVHDAIARLPAAGDLAGYAGGTDRARAAQARRHACPRRRATADHAAVRARVRVGTARGAPVHPPWTRRPRLRRGW
ncbi:methylated-DNA--[protein]-cysteine S-methyltransferase [Cupriavidus basilensis]